METKFTKGEWHFDTYRNLVAGGELLKVSGVTIPCNHSKIEVDANMNLIAAAPEMYELLETICTCSTVDIIDLGDGMTIDISGVEKLLAKARGES